MSIYLFESSTFCKNPRFWINEDIISRKKSLRQHLRRLAKSTRKRQPPLTLKSQRHSKKDPKKFTLTIRTAKRNNADTYLRRLRTYMTTSAESGRNAARKYGLQFTN